MSPAPERGSSSSAQIKPRSPVLTMTKPLRGVPDVVLVPILFRFFLIRIRKPTGRINVLHLIQHRPELVPSRATTFRLLRLVSGLLRRSTMTGNRCASKT